MKEAKYWIIGTPEQMRESIADFDQPIENAPFLIIEMAEKDVRVFGREAVLRMLGGFLYELNELLNRGAK